MCSLAQADVVYNASLQLEGPWNLLPKLRVPNPPAGDTRPMLNGSWEDDTLVSSYVNITEVQSRTVDPVTGAVSFVWGDQHDNHSGRWDPAWSYQLGEANAYVSDPALHTSGGNIITSTSMSAGVKLTDREALAESGTFWSRGFSLDPFSSFTFAATAGLHIDGDGPAIVAESRYLEDAARSFVQLTYGDTTRDFLSDISAGLIGFSGNLGDVFSHSVGPDGLLSLTITNSSSSVLRGYLGMESYVRIAPDVAAPVPEPATVLMVVSGVVAVGLAKRRADRKAGVATT